MNSKTQMSPSINTIIPEVKALDFYQALQEMMKGKKVTKEEWENKEEYGLMVDDYLCIHKGKNTTRWILRTADIEGLDYQILEDK